MDTPAGESSIQAADAEKAALERCLKVLKTAKSDTEIFAALLLITKLARAEAMTLEARNKIFKAVGFQFINRLLNTESVPEDCGQHMFQSLALTLLACFSTDPSLAHHPEMLDKVSFLAETTLIPRQSSDLSAHKKSMITDVYDILQAMTASEEGRKRLCQDVTKSLVIVIKEQLFGQDRSLSILSNLLYHNSDEMWTSQSASLNSLFQKLTGDFHQFQDAEKFTTCELLTSLLSVTSTVPATMPDWSMKIHNTLSGVIKNKLGEDHRDVCLKLAATMLHHYGASWVLQGHQQDNKFFLLLVNLASIEVRMILETMDQEKQLSKAAVLCCCFGILEQCIQLMVCNTEIMLGHDEIYQLHGVLTAAFGATILHLKSVTEEQFNDPVVLSCVRALFMWLAEETAQLKTEVIEVLPLLVNFCKLSLKATSLADDSKETVLRSNIFYHRLREDLIKLFLPGLCHLTAEKEPRDVLLRNEGMSILVSYTTQLLEENSLEVGIPLDETSLITLCNIFLNVILQDPTYVREHDQFRDLLFILSSQLKSLEEKSLVLLLHLGLVFVAVLRIKPVAKEFEGTMHDAIIRTGNLLDQVLRCEPEQLEATTDLETLKNLLCLILQCLMECIVLYRWVAVSVKKSEVWKESISDSSCPGWQKDAEVSSLLVRLYEQLSNINR